MGLHAILEAIRSDGEARVAELEKRAYAQAHELIANARLEAERIKENAYASALEPATREKARIIHRARLEALQTIGNTRKAMVDTALEQARGRLATIRTDPVYPRVMKKLLLEALTELEGSLAKERDDQTDELTKPHVGVHLVVDPRDRALVESLLCELDMQVSISDTLQCWGGLCARSEDGRVVVINTLEARLEQAIPYLRRFLAALFENDRPEAVLDRDLEWDLSYKTM